MMIYQVKEEIQGRIEYWVKKRGVNEEQENKGTGK